MSPQSCAWLDAVCRAVRPRERLPRAPGGRAPALSLPSRVAAGPVSTFLSRLSGLFGRPASSGSSGPAARPRPFRSTLAAVFAAALVAVMAALATPVSAQETVLVSNFGQTEQGLSNPNSQNRFAQAFTTGAHPGGYTLNRIDLKVSGKSDSTFTVELATGVSARVNTYTSVATLSRGNTGVSEFTAPANTVLSPNTRYFVVISSQSSSASVDRFKYAEKTATGETGETGWTIGDKRFKQQHTGSDWSNWGHPKASLPPPHDQTGPILIRVHGDEVPPPSLLNAAVNGRTVTLTFDRELDPRSAPAGHAFTVAGIHGGGIRTGTGTASIAGRAATVTLDLAITHGDWVSVSYARPATGNRLRDLAGGEVESFTGKRAANRTAHAAPEFQSAGIRQGRSQYLTINFTNALDADSEPPDSAFTVRATSPNGRTRTIGGVPTGTVNVSGSLVYLELASAVEPDEAVTLSYSKPSANPLIDEEGLAVESFSDKGVSNGAPMIRSMAIVSDPGADRTYGRGDTVRVQVTFTEPVVLDRRGGTPRLKLNQGESHWQKSDSQGGRHYPWAEYESGSRTPTLTFAYTVKSLDRSDGIAVTDQLELAGGRIRSVWSWPVRDAELPDPPRQFYAPQHWLDHDRNHRVDGSVSRPKLVSASVDEATLTARFNETLDTGFVPAPGAFRVTVNGARRNVASGGVSISGATVTLTLSSAVAGSDTVTLGYVRPGSNGLRNAAGHLVESFDDRDVTNGTPAGGFWSATLTVRGPAGGSSIGCFGSQSQACGSALTADSFTTGGTAYRITELYSSTSGNGLALRLDKAFPTSWTLHVGDRQFSVADANRHGDDKFASWAGSAMNWTVGETVSLRLTGSAGDGGATGNAAPNFRSASVSGNKLKVTYDEPLDEGSTPPGSSFRVRAMPDGGARGALSTPTSRGGPGGNGPKGARSPASGGGAGNIGGTGTVRIDGATVTVTLDRPVAPGERLVVSYNRPGENAIRDPAGAEAAGFTARPATNVVAVTAVAVVSDAGADDTYALGETIRVRVTFGETVAVDTSGGTPRVKIKMDPRWGEFWATYESGGGTNALTFVHEVAEPNTSPTGIAVLANTLETGGGTIRSAATQVNANLAHAGLGHDAKHKVNWRLAPSGPAVTAVSVVSDAGADDTYALGETIRVRVAFGETVAVDTSGGTPRVKIKMDPRWGEFWAAYESGSGTAALTFAYTVARPNTAPTGIAVLANTLQLNGGTIASAATGTNANLAHAGLGHDSDHKVDWRLSPPGTAAVTAVAVVSDAGGDDTYALGETISVRVTFGETVNVSGTPRVKIKMDPRWGEFWASYKSGSGTAALTFVHKVAKPNTSPTGIAVLANTLQLNGGTIASAATGTNANLAHSGLGHDSDHKVDWRLSPPGAVGTAATAAPAATVVAVVSDAGADDTYMLGETIRVRLAFGETVNVSGTPRMKIKMDPRWGEKWAAYESGSGTAALTFAWTVVEPNYAPQGIAVLANTLALNGGTIRSAAGTDATLGHTGLGHDATHKVDWRPTLSVADAQANEGAAAVAFEVSLNRTFSGTAHRVTVNYATADGTAKAGEDYTATSGSLTFAAGERVKTVRVPLLDDAIDEGEETFTLRLSNAKGARIGDGEATGTIANADPLQKMWLSRFGRTVASHVTDAVSDRLANPLTGAQVTVGGQRVDFARTGDEKWLGQTLTSVARALGAPNGPEPGGPGWGSPGSGLGQAWAGPGSGSGTSLGIGGTSAPGSTATRDLSGRELLLGSAFHLAREGGGGRPGLAAWGRVTVGGFDGEAPADDGTVRIDGDVTTGILGADAKWNRLLAGVAVSVSEGKGAFAQPGVDSGKIESTMTTVSPYARFMVTDRISVWGLAGWGTGDMTIVQAANENQPERTTRTDLEMRLAAIGGRGALLEADEAGGFDLALKADAFYVETESEAVSNEGSTTGVASRVRLALEGSRAFETGGGTFTPGLEVGLRHDGGDAETGTGVELGGRLSWVDADSGLSAEARVRTLIAHKDSGYKEWGASGSVRLDPGERARGLSLSLSPTWGAASSGAGRLWSARDARGLAPGREFQAESRLQAEVGYGLGLLGDRFTGTPNLGVGFSDTARDYRIGWRLTSAVRGDPGFEVNLDATRREAANGNEPAEHEAMLRAAIRW